MTTEDKIALIRKTLDEKKAEDVRDYDVRGKSTITDRVVAATATSAPHLRALSVAVQRALAEKAGEHGRTSGDAASAWIVVDDWDVMVHLFLADARAYYDIESLWK